MSEYLVYDFNIANDQLIRDLYIEWSKCSKESWGIYNKYSLFAQQLLDRGGSKYLLDYLTGASYSFDTRLASGRITVSDDLRKEIIDCAKDQLTKTTDKATRRLWEFALQRFDRKKTKA